MKKALYIGLTAAAVALSACTREEMPSSQVTAPKGSIQFAAPMVNKAVTRATGDVTNKSVKDVGVKVYASNYATGSTWDASSEKVFNGETIAWSADESRWAYSGTPKLWAADKTYDFSAVAPAVMTNGTTAIEEVDGKIKVSKFPIAQVIDNTESAKKGDDLMVSDLVTTTEQAAGVAGVSFQMNHILSKLAVYSTVATTAEYNVDLTDVQIYMPSAEHTASFEQTAHDSGAAGTWTWTAFTSAPGLKTKEAAVAAGYAAYDLGGLQGGGAVAKTDATTDKAQASAVARQLFVVPTPADYSLDCYAEISYTIYTDRATRNETKFIPVTGLKKFVSGNLHNLFIRISPELIKFEVGSVAGWDSYEDFTTDITSGPKWQLTAEKEVYHIKGTVKESDDENAPIENTYTYVSLIEAGGSENLLKDDVIGSVVTLTEKGAFVLENSKINFGPIKQNTGYVLSIESSAGSTQTAAVNFGTWDEMQFTLETYRDDWLYTTYKSFTIPFDRSQPMPADLCIVWGDGSNVEIIEGTSTNYSTPAFKKTYAETGTYVVKIISSQTDRTKKQVPALNFKKYLVPGSGYNADPSGKLLKSVDTPLLFMDTDDFSGVFYSTFLKSVHKDVFKFNPGITTLKEAFGDTRLTVADEVIFSYTPEVKDFSYVFSNVPLEQIPADLFKHNKKAENFSNALKGARAPEIPVTLFVENTLATNFSHIFQYVSQIKGIPAALFEKNTLATDFSYAFDQCSNLEEIPATLFEKNTLVKNFTDVFSACKKIESIPVTLFKTNRAATDFTRAFSGCTALSEIPDGIFDYNTEVTSFQNVFSSCTVLTDIPENLFAKNSKVFNFSYIFFNSTNVVLNENIFISPQVTAANRFNGQKVQFDGAFKGVKNGTAPKLWDTSVYKGLTFGWYASNSMSTPPFDPDDQTEFTNKNQIPNEWKNSDVTLETLKYYPNWSYTGF